MRREEVFRDFFLLILEILQTVEHVKNRLSSILWHLFGRQCHSKYSINISTVSKSFSRICLIGKGFFSLNGSRLGQNALAYCLLCMTSNRYLHKESNSKTVSLFYEMGGDISVDGHVRIWKCKALSGPLFSSWVEVVLLIISDYTNHRLRNLNVSESCESGLETLRI